MSSFYEFVMNPWVLSFIIAFILIYTFFFVWPWLFGAPFEPTKEKKVKKMIKLAKIKKTDKAVDLGSGDGRLVIALAKAGAKEAHGYEINPLLVFISRRRIKKARLQKKAKIHWANFWRTSLKDYDVVTLFQFPTIMKRLGKKLRRELKKGSRVVSYHWKFHNWKPSKVVDKDIYLYKKK
jgi:hypothetical protein